MELLAAIKALQSIKKSNSIALHTDSRYVVNGIEKKWAKNWKAKDWMRTPTEKAKNPDLWNELLKQTEKHQVTFVWVKGHAGIVENERCDELVNAQSAKDNQPLDQNYEEKQTESLIFRF